MVYIYYMKIKIFLFTFFFLFPGLVQAQVTVVRVEKNTVYLDTSSLEQPVQKDDSFKVVLSTEKLTNPTTGKELGLIKKYSAEGKITEVQPLYSVGQLPKGETATVGQEAIIEQISPRETDPKEAPKKKLSQRKMITYSPVAQEIISLSAADVIQPEAHNIITLSKDGRITVWKRNGETLDEESSYQLPKTKTPLTLSAAPVRGQETAEIFATTYDPHTNRISTLALSYEKKQWNVLDTLPYFVKELGCAPNKTVWIQKPFVIDVRPGDAHNLIYENGHFKPGEQTLPTQRNWLTGTAYAPVEKTEGANFLYTAKNGKIKMRLANKKNVESKSLFAFSPNRVKYKQELITFYPSLQILQSQGKTEVVGVENVAKYGLLSSTFGMYQNGKIHFLLFEKGRLNVSDSVELDGFVYDTACAANAVLTAEVLPDGQSSVVEIFN